MSNHTPGPWIAVEKFGFIGSIQGGVIREYANGTSQDQLFMVCCVQDDNGGRTATNANARLIAAAPDLLEALQHLMVAHGEQLDYAFQQAQEAIAKATGETV
jgi:hypothetical protein